MQISFKTYCDKGNLQSVRDFVRNSLSEQGINDTDAYMTVLAVDEICANLIIHANGCNGSKEIDLQMRFLPNQVSITITDYGVSFNYNNHIDTTLEALVAGRRKGGLGLTLVKRIMDEVTYESISGKNSWVLSKRIQAA